MNKSLFILILLFFSGCATLPNNPITSNQASIKNLTLSVDYIDTNNQHISSQSLPKTVNLVFPHIPGQIFGNPIHEALFIVKLKIGEKVKFDLNKAEQTLKKSITPLKKVTSTKGLSITPQATRFSRIATYSYDASTDKAIGAGGFLDISSREKLLLMYFDRPCTLIGKTKGGGDEADLNIKILSTGFHWLHTKKTGKNKYKISNHQAKSKVIFSITP